MEQICSAAEMEGQRRFMRRFHLARRRADHRTELADRADFTQDNATALVACRSCGFLCRQTRPTPGAATFTYAHDHYGAAQLEREYLNQRRWAEGKLRELARWLVVPAGLTPFVVEVGSFVGGFLATGQDHGWKMLGVDPGKEVASFCHRKGLPVHVGTLNDAPLLPCSVDAVAIWNTFDQLPNPDTTLAAVRRVLRPEGVLVIRIPNGLAYRRAWAWHRRAPRPVKSWIATAMVWNNLLAFPYIYGYDPSSLDSLLSRHGFARVGLVPDQLMQLADEGSTRYAEWEERLVKWAGRLFVGCAQLLGSTGASSAPWLDLYYRAAETAADTPISVGSGRAGISIEPEPAYTVSNNASAAIRR
jgi:SAM-dependent methyltransferase